MAKVEKGKSGKGATPKSSAKKEAAVPEISQDSGNEHQFAPRLRETYREQVVPALMKEFSYGNLMQVPRLERIVLNVGMGEAIQNVKLLESASNELGIITGQKPVTTRAKKAIAGFKLRQGMPFKKPGRSKFTELMANHVFCDEDGNKLLPIVHGKRVPNHIRHNRRTTRPGFNQLPILRLIHLLNFFHQMIVNEWTLGN